jgi:tRNA-(ms[2]io[6]A)-hydroxylase
MSGPKRRLPVLQPKDDDGVPRPPWQWSALGGVATFLAFVPLAFGAVTLARRTHAAYIPTSDPAEVQRAVAAMTASQRLWLGVLTVLGPFVALAVSSFAGGLFVGRFGGEAGKKEAALGGLVAASVCSLVSAGQFVSGPGAHGCAAAVGRDGATVALHWGDVAGWLLTSAVLFTVGGIAAYFGGALGVRLRRSA